MKDYRQPKFVTAPVGIRWQGWGNFLRGREAGFAETCSRTASTSLALTLPLSLARAFALAYPGVCSTIFLPGPLGILALSLPVTVVPPLLPTSSTVGKGVKNVPPGSPFTRGGLRPPLPLLFEPPEVGVLGEEFCPFWPPFLHLDPTGVQPSEGPWLGWCVPAGGEGVEKDEFEEPFDPFPLLFPFPLPLRESE